MCDIILFTGTDPIPLPADTGETESLAQYLEAIGTNPNLIPYVGEYAGW